jgi:hypothetical protein
MKVLIVGGSSYIGKALKPYLEEAGMYVDCTFHATLDLAMDPSTWCHAVLEGYDAAVILAAITGENACSADPLLSHKVNVDNTYHLISMLVRNGTHVVFPSTSADRVGVGHYGIQKQTLENNVRQWVDRGEVTIIRPPRITDDNMLVLNAQISGVIRHAVTPKTTVMGSHTTETYNRDPKHLAFALARYKFVSKMLAGKKGVLEVGCGDMFGSPIVAQEVDAMLCTDINTPPPGSDILNMGSAQHNFVGGPPFAPVYEAAFSIDVIEHISPHEEAAWLTNIADSLTEHGVMLVGTPNKTAEQYASKISSDAHVNLHTYESLKATMEEYFHNVFMFGMNDEVVHTGFAPMCHYLWALCTTRK